MAPFFLLSPRENRGGAERRRRRPIRALCASAAARGRGERRRGLCGVDPRPHLVPGWSVAARPRWPAAAGGGASGGGAAAEERGLGVAVELVGAKGDAEAPFIGEMRRWG